MIKVLLADDHALVRAGIRSLLNAMNEVEVVAEASSGEEAIELVTSSHPDVVLMDIAMKGITGLEAAARMRDRNPEVRVVILSMHSGEEYVLQALRAGAVGYLLKDAATGELELALRSVMRGESWLSPSVSRQVVEGYMHRTGGETAPDVLTARQREVLKLVAGGKISRGLGQLLKAELTAAQELLNRGRISAARTLLRAIVVEIDLLVRLRALTAADAAPLRAAILQVISSL